MALGILTGEKVLLRPLERRDLQEIHKWVNNENIIKYLSFAVFPQSIEETQESLERDLIKKDPLPKQYKFAISQKDDPERLYIGACGFFNIDYRQRSSDIAITISREELMSKGLGTDAIKLLLDFGFNTLNMHKINISYFAYNERGARCYEKCGFRQEGRLRDMRFYNGRYYDIVLMGITEQEYRAAEE